MTRQTTPQTKIYSGIVAIPNFRFILLPNPDSKLLGQRDTSTSGSRETGNAAVGTFSVTTGCQLMSALC